MMINTTNEEFNKITLEQGLIFDSVPVWIFYKDSQNSFIKVNKAFCDAMGKAKSELEGKSLFDIFPKEQADKYWQDDKEIISSGKAMSGIIETINTPLGQRWVQTNKVPYKDKKGNVIGVVGFTFDITDRRAAEEASVKSQVMLQRIIDLLPIRIFWIDNNLKYLGCNLIFAKDAGKESVNEVIGKDDFQMGWKDQADAYRTDDFAVIQTQTPKINYEEEQTTPNGNKIWLLTNKVVLKDTGGSVEGVLGTYVDITDKKQTEDKLAKALEDARKMNEIMVNRELKMVELKNRIAELENKLPKN